MTLSTRVSLFACVTAGTLLVGSAACSSHPDSMHIEQLGIELVPSTRYVANRPAGERAFAILFKGDAPFAAIAKDGRIPQFECELHDAAGAVLDAGSAGRMYFDGATMPVDAATGLVSMEHGESYRYRAVLYFGLRAKTTINGPFDIDLLRAHYDHVACRLRGSQMFPSIWMSNDLVVTRGELRWLAEAGNPAR
jgi:hypothetical protein